MIDDEEFDGPENADPGGAPKTLVPRQTAPGYRGVNRKIGWGAAAVFIAIIALGIWTVVNHRDPAPASAEPPSILTASADQPLPDPSPTPVVRRAEVPRPAPTAAPAQPPMPAAAPPIEQQSQPREKSAEELAAEEEVKRRIDARRASSRMALEAPESGAAQQQLAALGVPASPTSIASAQSGHAQLAPQASGGVGYVAPTSNYEINETTIIPARLLTAVDSTLPGLIKAQVTTAVYDSRTHSAVVIPAGTFLVGQYDSQTIAGQARLMAVWTRILFPDGRSFLMGQAQGSGAKGEAGMSASVDNHTGRAFGAAFLYTMLGAAGNLMSNAINRNSSVIELGNVARSVQQPQRPAPTMHLYPGALFNVMVTQDLPLERYDGSR